MAAAARPPNGKKGRRKKSIKNGRRTDGGEVGILARRVAPSAEAVSALKSRSSSSSFFSSLSHMPRHA
jgi:hypothetical protein